MIERVNDQFLSTWILKDDMKTLAAKGDKLAQCLAANFEHPLDLMLLTPQGQLVSRLNSFHDFPAAHPDVSRPHFKKKGQKKYQSHAEVFLENLDQHFGGK